MPAESVSRGFSPRTSSGVLHDRPGLRPAFHPVAIGPVAIWPVRTPAFSSFQFTAIQFSAMALDTFQSALPQAVVNRILIVDDEDPVVESLSAILEGAGLDVVVARDGGQAHSAFTMRHPDFVLCDLKLAGKETGFEICERFKQANRRIPVVILTAIDLPRARRLAERVGADDYLTKPIDGHHLLARIREVADLVWRRSMAEDAAPAVPQSIRFACRCGKRFKVSEQHRGKTLTCPNCGEPVIVPRHA